MRTRTALPVIATLMLGLATAWTRQAAADSGDAAAARPEDVIRVATYNIALYGEQPGELARRLRGGHDRNARGVAEVIQRVRPDVLLLCEIDYEPAADAVAQFVGEYLERPQAAGLAPAGLVHCFIAPVNTGEPSGLDLDGDGRVGGPGDAWGYGRYPGQYGMAVVSRLPIERARSRTFRMLRWASLPGARRPTLPSGGHFYDDTAWPKLRLPSKSLWDVAVRVPGGGRLHAICSHPTPPVFDGPEDRNGLRNADEVRLLSELLESPSAAWLRDDAGHVGGLAEGEPAVVLGDLNADPTDGDGDRQSIGRLLASPRLAGHPAPRSEGGVRCAAEHPALYANRRGDPAEDTADFSGDGHSGLRVDYALASAECDVVGGGVFWPAEGQPGAEAVRASDHRLVWVDLRVPLTQGSDPPADR